MKRATIYAIIIAACALMTGCATDGAEQKLAGATTKLSVSVSDNGFANADGTRVSDSEYTTTFTDGDAIGVFAVVDGEVSQLANNMKMTYDDETKSWKGETLYDIGGATYYAYYPYQSKLTVTPSATTTDGFFADLISKWKVKDDQTKYADYAASDLMAAQATAKDGKLSFTMDHMMALVMIALPKYVYTYTNTSGNGGGTFDRPTSINLNWTSPTDFAPYEQDGKFRYIYNENFNVSGRFDAQKFSQDVAFTRGTCYALAIDGAATKKQEIKVGDYFMRDGTIKSQSTTLSAGEEADVIGYVFYLGHHANDESDYSATGIGLKECHGYVFSSKGYESYYWYDSNHFEDIPTIKNEDTSTDHTSNTDWSGYYNTQELRKYTLGLYDKYNDLSSDTTKYVGVGVTKIVAPTNTSAWFIPTAAQVLYVKDVGLYYKTGIESLRGSVWTSTELENQGNTYSASNTVFIWMNYLQYNSKSLYIGLCPVLAF